MAKYDHNQICTHDNQVEVGGEYQYYEDGYVANVVVLEDQSNDEGVGFKFKVTSYIRWTGKPCDEFSCWAARRLTAGGAGRQ